MLIPYGFFRISHKTLFSLSLSVLFLLISLLGANTSAVASTNDIAVCHLPSFDKQEAFITLQDFSYLNQKNHLLPFDGKASNIPYDIIKSIKKMNDIVYCLKSEVDHILFDDSNLVKLKQGNDFYQYAFAISNLWSPIKQKAVILCGGSAPCELFLNEEKIMSSDVGLTNEFGSQFIPITLKKGDNYLFIYSKQKYSEETFSYNLCLTSIDTAKSLYAKRYKRNFIWQNQSKSLNELIIDPMALLFLDSSKVRLVHVEKGNIIPLNANKNNGKISIPNAISEGFYYCEVFSNDQVLLCQPVFLGNFLYQKLDRLLHDARKRKTKVSDPNLLAKIKHSELYSHKSLFSLLNIPEYGENRQNYFDITIYNDVDDNNIFFRKSNTYSRNPNKTVIEINDTITKIIVTSHGNSSNKWNCLVEFIAYDKNGEKIKVETVKANEEQRGNPAINAIDNNYSSYWASYGINNPITFSFNDSTFIQKIQLVWKEEKQIFTPYQIVRLNMNLATRIALDLHCYLNKASHRGEQILGFYSNADGTHRIYKLYVPEDIKIKKSQEKSILVRIPYTFGNLEFNESFFFRSTNISDYFLSLADALGIMIASPDIRIYDMKELNPIGIQDTLQCIEKLKQEFEIEHIIGMGHCNGGRSLILLAELFPTLFSAIGLHSPSLQSEIFSLITDKNDQFDVRSPLFNTSYLSTTSIYNVHGTSDTHIPIDFSDILAEILNQKSFSYKYDRLQAVSENYYPFTYYDRMFTFLLEDRNDFTSKNFPEFSPTTKVPATFEFFMQPFALVEPLDPNKSVEFEVFFEYYKKQFYGECRTIKENEINNSILNNFNLLFFTPPSNPLVTTFYESINNIEITNSEIIIGNEKIKGHNTKVIRVLENSQNKARKLLLSISNAVDPNDNIESEYFFLPTQGIEDSYTFQDNK